MIAQQIINAASLGGVYALLALGLAIVFYIVGLINFVHGEPMTVSGYALLASLGLGLLFRPPSWWRWPAARSRRSPWSASPSDQCEWRI